MSNSTAVRHFIREWRVYRKLTQEQLAERAGMTHSMISLLERGKREYSQSTLETLAEALRCKPGDLLSTDPTEAGRAIDLTALLRGVPPLVRQQILAVVATMLHSAHAVSSGNEEALEEEEDEDLFGLGEATTTIRRTPT